MYQSENQGKVKSIYSGFELLILCFGTAKKNGNQI